MTTQTYAQHLKAAARLRARVLKLAAKGVSQAKIGRLVRRSRQRVNQIIKGQ